MRNIRLELEYDGANYCGWQVQPCTRKDSLQYVLERTLHKLLQEKIKLTASGRTDAGVHALRQVANFKTNSGLELPRIKKALNSLLADDIVITGIKEVECGFNARYNAKSKTYRYLILNNESGCAFLNRFSWPIPYSLDTMLMRQEIGTLVGRHDFRSFCASNSNVKTTVRTIKKVFLKSVGYPLFGKTDKLITIEIEADGFLYNMVRNIIGTLVEIGRGRFKKGSLRRILLAKDRKAAGPCAPAKGLFLVKVTY